MIATEVNNNAILSLPIRNRQQRLQTLWEIMTKFQGSEYAKCIELISKIAQSYNVTLTTGKVKLTDSRTGKAIPSSWISTEIEKRIFLNSDLWEWLMKTLRELEVLIADMDMPMTKKNIQRLLEIFSKDVEEERVPILLEPFLTLARDEFGENLLLTVDSKYANLYDKSIESFGPEVKEKFPSALFDIEEAAKCLALDRWTACVYHLSRIFEIGLVAIARYVKCTDHSPSWKSALNAIDAAIDIPYEQNPYKGKLDFLRDVRAQIYAVKDAWRNKVAHIEQKYTEPEAVRIMNATIGFMQKLATELEEAENG